MNKVFTSEALAYVVDEALQVFGGNGYSREFPAERAYRDARITRIYEGTNEINRLIIPTRLLKDRSGLQQDDETQPPFAGGLLSTERGVLARIKSLAVGMLTEAAMLYGDTIRDQQEILGHIADVVIEAYAIESAAARAEKMAASRGPDSAAVALDMVRVYVTDAVDRIVHSGKQVARALPGERGALVQRLLTRIRDFEGVDTVEGRRHIAAAVIAAGKHPY